MIEVLTFAIGKPDYDKEYMISYDGEICYAEILDTSDNLSTKKIKAEDFEKKILPFEQIGIYKWRKDYYVEPKDFKDNDISWVLQYQEVGKRCRSISGYGKFPDGWEEFLKAIYNVFPSFKYKEYIKG